jgi:hypothetical protein
MRKSKDNAEARRGEEIRGELGGRKLLVVNRQGAMAIVAVQIADLEIAGIVLKHAGL